MCEWERMGKQGCDREAVEQMKVKLSAFTYLNECFQSACLIISSPFFICTPFDPKATGRKETFRLSLLPWLYHTRSYPSLTLSLTPHPLWLAFVIRVITICFLSICTCSSYLPHAPCSCCLSPCFMHKRILPYLCPEMCVCKS